MKKFVLFLVLSFICIGTVCAADEYKDLDKAPKLDVDGAYIFDIKPFRKMIKDNIAFLNMSSVDEISFDIYFVYYNTGEWIKNREKGHVRGYNDRDIVDLNETIKLKKIPFIAIVPNPDDDFEFKIYPKSHDIYIEISD